MFTGTIPTASNRATWSESFELRDESDNSLIDLSGVNEITLEVRDIDTRVTKLSCTLSGGDIVVVSTGVFQWRFEASTMRSLDSGTYEVGCTIEQSDDTVQILIGYVPVLDGIVS